MRVQQMLAVVLVALAVLNGMAVGQCSGGSCPQLEKCTAENPNLWGLRFNLGMNLSVSQCAGQCRQGGGNGYLCLSAVTGMCLCGTSAKPRSTNPATTGCTATCTGSDDQCGGPPSLYSCYAAGAAPPTHTPTDAPTETPSETPTDTPTETPTATPTETPPAAETATATASSTHVTTATHTPSDEPCAATPQSGCVSGKSTLRLWQAHGHAQLRWRVRRGAIDANTVGDPNAAPGYQLCLYADEVLLKGFALTPGNDWVRRRGDLRYRRHDGAPDGIVRLSIHADSRRGTIYASGRGDFLQLPALPLEYSSAVRIQLSNGPACWESLLTAPARNNANRFIDRAP